MFDKKTTTTTKKMHLNMKLLFCGESFFFNIFSCKYFVTIWLLHALNFFKVKTFRKIQMKIEIHQILKKTENKIYILLPKKLHSEKSFISKIFRICEKPKIQQHKNSLIFQIILFFTRETHLICFLMYFWRNFRFFLEIFIKNFLLFLCIRNILFLSTP